MTRRRVLNLYTVTVSRVVNGERHHWQHIVAEQSARAAARRITYGTLPRPDSVTVLPGRGDVRPLSVQIGHWVGEA